MANEINAYAVASAAQKTYEAAPFPGTAFSMAQGLRDAAGTLMTKAVSAPVIKTRSLLDGQWGTELRELQARTELYLQWIDQEGGGDPNGDPEAWQGAAALLLGLPAPSGWQKTYGNEATAKAPRRGDVFRWSTLANQLQAAIDDPILWKTTGPIDSVQQFVGAFLWVPILEVSNKLNPGAGWFPEGFDAGRDLRAIVKDARKNAEDAFSWVKELRTILITGGVALAAVATATVLVVRGNRK